ncbi:MAG: PKD domain-containing protein, partial [ANME-2 cluster archaeon]|nr:PKD domain-containing protein [ANME-2 cluster archaeon]
MTVTDSVGATADDTAEVTVGSGLAAEANGPYSGPVGVAISFSGSASGGTDPYTYSWDFGDGESITEPNPSHTYATADTYTATLTVTDNDGSTADDTTEVTVGSGLAAEANGPYSGPVGV